jgi:GT2 family glycosyltransferase
MKRLSVILPFYKRLSAFEQALKINHGYLAGERDTEIVLVLDEPSEEEGVLRLVQAYDQLSWRVIINRQDHVWRNPARAINVGLRHALGEYALVMSPESLHVTNVPKTLFAASTNSEAALFSVGRICWCPRQIVNEKGLSAAFDETEPKRFYGSICAPRAAFEEVRGYDESNHTWGCDDDNIRERLMLCGLKPGYAPYARAIHPLEAGEVNHNQIRQTDKTPTERDLYLRPSTTCVNDADWGREFDEVIFEKDHA